jgi:hypothetical protein
MRWPLIPYWYCWRIQAELLKFPITGPFQALWDCFRLAGHSQQNACFASRITIWTGCRGCTGPLHKPDMSVWTGFVFE